MNFDPDKPKSSMKEDALGRRKYAEYLGNALLSYTCTDNLVVGIYDEWGAGKTTLINFVVEHIKDTTGDSPAAPVILYFNPWHFADTGALIAAFFKALSRALKRPQYDEHLNKAGEYVEAYGETLLTLWLLPKIGPVAGVGGMMMMGAGRTLKKYAKALKRDLDQTRQELQNHLKAQSRRIIVIIDDIDRLVSDEIRQVFQLVKSLADFPNTIYLLAFDPVLVAKALNKPTEDYGATYLEKIVQVPFVVPKAPQEVLSKYVRDKVLARRKDVPERRWNDTHWYNMYEWNITHFIRNLRDANRYLNIWRFNFDLLKDHIHFVDIAGLTALQVFCEPVYRGIRDNPLVFKQDIDSTIQLPDDDRKEAMKRIVERMRSEVAEEDWRFAETILTVLFPNVETGHKLQGTRWTEYGEELESGRVCDPENYLRAFAFDVPSWEVSDTEVESLWRSVDTSPIAELEERLEALCRSRDQDHVFKRLGVVSSNVTPQTTVTLVRACLNIAERIGIDQYGASSYLSIVSVFSAKILARFPHSSGLDEVPQPDERERILLDLIQDYSGSLWPLVFLIRYVKPGHKTSDGYAAEGNFHETLLSSGSAERIQEAMRVRIESETQGHLFWSYAWMPNVISVWSRIGGEKVVRAYIAQETKSEAKFVNLLERIRPAEGNLEFLAKLFDLLEARKRIDHILAAESGQKLNSDQEETLVLWQQLLNRVKFRDETTGQLV